MTTSSQDSDFSLIFRKRRSKEKCECTECISHSPELLSQSRQARVTGPALK